MLLINFSPKVYFTSNSDTTIKEKSKVQNINS